MNTREAGNTTEAALLADFAARRFSVLIPFGDGHPFDLVVHLGQHHFLRVQCKTAWIKGGCAIFNTRSTDHGRGPISYDGIADVFGVYLPARDSIYLVPVREFVGTEGRLRIENARNSQRRRIRFAADYEIARWTKASLLELVEAGPPAQQLLSVA